jgi:hypothetical protein
MRPGTYYVVNGRKRILEARFVIERKGHGELIGRSNGRAMIFIC